MFTRDRLFRELRDEMRRLAGSIDTLRVETARIADTQADVKDHEDRLRRVERWMYALPVSLLSSAAAVVIAWLGRIH
jgi:hypothetical protein